LPIVTGLQQPSFVGVGAGISGSPTICTFGGLGLPNGQGTLSPISLNDVTNWFLQDVVIDHANRAIGISPLIARARSVYVSDDFLNKSIVLTLRYQETYFALGTALAQLSQAGEQRLSFDNVTAILAKYKGIRSNQPKLVRKYPPFLWEMDLEFICREPWFKDISSTQVSPVSLVAAPPTGPVATALAGGSLAVGTYTLAYTYVTASGETAASPATTTAPGFAQSDYRTARIESRGGSRSTGSALQTGMGGAGPRSRMVRGFKTSSVIPQGTAVVLVSGTQQISVGAVTLPTWATAVKWYIMSGPTTGFTVQNANGNAFTLNTAGNGVAPPVSSSGTASFNVTYAGSVWAEPVYSLVIPSSNSNTITSLVLTNTMTGEALTVNFPGGLPGGRAYTITIDAGAWTITDQSANTYDYSGSFPMLYPPAGQVNPFTVQAVGTPANPTGLTLSATYTNRWEL
jgi:hypothetical protein